MNWWPGKNFTLAPVPESVHLGNTQIRKQFDQLCASVARILPRDVVDLAVRVRVTRVNADHWICYDFTRHSHSLDPLERRILHLLLVWWNTPLRMLLYKKAINTAAQRLGRKGPSLNKEANERAAAQGARDMKQVELYLHQQLQQQPLPIV